MHTDNVGAFQDGGCHGDSELFSLRYGCLFEIANERQVSRHSAAQADDVLTIVGQTKRTGTFGREARQLFWRPAAHRLYPEVVIVA